MTITGTWRGYYQYGNGYELQFFGEKVNITVVFEEVDEGFIGTVEEEKSPFSVALKSTIKGFVDEEKYLSFVKTYPGKPVISERDRTKMEILDGIAEVEHWGNIDEEFDSIYGGWLYSYHINNVIQEDHQIDYHGIWLLKRYR